MMSSLVTAVFKATIGLLVSTGRDILAEKLNEGDVTDQRVGRLIVREISEISSKLHGLAKSPLLTSISLFREGIELLYEVFKGTRPSSEHHAITAVATACAKQFDIAKEIRNLELSSLDEPSTRKLDRAKRRFEEARLQAVIAFQNEALALPDRLLAMKYRLMATILETVDHPSDALVACRVCLDELHKVQAVKECFNVALGEGLRARINRDERRQIIFSVCHSNRVIYDVMSVLGSVKMWTLPEVETEREKVDPLRNERVVKALTKQNEKHCCLLWSFGQEGEEKHMLKCPWGIATNTNRSLSPDTRRQFLIADHRDKTVKVFDSNGKFAFRFNPQTDDADTEFNIWDVATTGEGDNMYLLVGLKKPGTEKWESEVQVFNMSPDLQHKFPVRNEYWRLTVSSGKQSGKILLLAGNVVDVHELSGEFVCSFGERVFKRATDITATCDGRVMIVDRDDYSAYLFDVEGHQLGKFNIKYDRDVYCRIACHPANEHVVLAGRQRETRRLMLAIYTVNGEFVRRIQLNEEVRFVNGITVTVEGHIAVALREHTKGKVIVV